MSFGCKVDLNRPRSKAITRPNLRGDGIVERPGGKFLCPDLSLQFFRSFARYSAFPFQLQMPAPCTIEIAQFEKAIHDSASNPYAGLMAPQSVAAQIDRQPTPESLEQTRNRLRSQFAATMARAKRMDAKGDRAGCTSALNAARRMYIL